MVCLSGPNWPPCVIAGCKVDSYYYYIDIIIFKFGQMITLKVHNVCA